MNGLAYLACLLNPSGDRRSALVAQDVHDLKLHPASVGFCTVGAVYLSGKFSDKQDEIPSSSRPLVAVWLLPLTSITDHILPLTGVCQIQG